MKIPVDLVIFDLDGTLADTGRDLANAVNHTRAQFKLLPLPEALIVAHVGRGMEYLLKQTVPEERADRFPEVLRLFLQRYESHLLDATALYPGVRPVLLHFQHKKRAVVSNKIYRLTTALLDGLGVRQHFDLVLGGDSAPEKKPHPALLNEALSRFKIVPQRAVMVGDGDTDIEAGKRAGVVTCGVTYGLGSKADLIAATPDFLIDDLAELPNYFC